jgi:hypothetical protein
MAVRDAKNPRTSAKSAVSQYHMATGGGGMYWTADYGDVRRWRYAMRKIRVHPRNPRFVNTTWRPAVAGSTGPQITEMYADGGTRCNKSAYIRVIRGL